MHTENSHLLKTYSPLNVAFTHGKGVYLYDQTGKAYLDALGGIAVCALGHAHPDIIDIIHSQSKRLLHTSNLYHIPQAEELATRLASLTGLSKVFFANSGAEANECALKLIRLYGHAQGYTVPKVIVMDAAFHGRTLAMLSATANPKVRQGFEPFVEGFIRAPVDDLAALEDILQKNPDIAAIFFEVIQGEGGLYPLSEVYLQGIEALRQRYNFLIVVDEIQTGIGRTGKFCAYMHHNLSPDIVTFAKALGNGIPIGACVLSEAVSKYIHVGQHGSTFGGNPFATAVATRVLSVIERDKLMERAEKLGNYLKKRLTEKLSRFSQVKAVRGKGLMLGIVLDRPCREILNIALKQGILFSVTAGQVLRLLPPYILSDQEAELLLTRMESVIHTWCQEVAND